MSDWSLFDEQPIWHRRAFACAMLVLGVILLFIGTHISLGLWKFIANYLLAPAAVLHPRHATNMVDTVHLGTVLLSGGGTLSWLGVRELRACRN